jgi:hypothetical protein
MSLPFCHRAGEEIVKSQRQLIGDKEATYDAAIPANHNTSRADDHLQQQANIMTQTRSK